MHFPILGGGDRNQCRKPGNNGYFPDRLLKDLEWLGFLFESLVIRDLRVLAQALDGEVFHYRDKMVWK